MTARKKIAYVTGGMGGIGTAICQRLHKDGFTVIAGCGPSRDHAKWLGEQEALGFTFHASVGNVGDWDSTVDAFQQGPRPSTARSTCWSTTPASPATACSAR